MSSRFITVLLVWYAGAVATPPRSNPLPAAIDQAIQQVTVAELREHISILASDRLSGRGLGHEGNKEAEVYIAGAFRGAKVLAAAPNYLQHVDVYSPHLGPAASLSISAPNRTI